MLNKSINNAAVGGAVETIQQAENRCAEQHCSAQAEYTAPIAKSADGEICYRRFCKFHAREWNGRWNYFADMSDEQVDALRHFLQTGHARGDDDVLYALIAKNHLSLQDEIARLSGAKTRRAGTGAEDGKNQYNGSKTNASAISASVRLALSHLQLPALPHDARLLKKQFRSLVKRFHPDVMETPAEKHRGSEQIKRINAAYSFLRRYMQKG